MPERRAHARKKLVLPVKISDATQTQFVHTVDISCAGVRIGNLRSQVEIGKTITLSRGTHKAKFRVAWVREIGPKEIQAGLESLQPADNLLGVDVNECRNSSEELVMNLIGSKSQRGKRPPR